VVHFLDVVFVLVQQLREKLKEGVPDPLDGGRRVGVEGLKEGRKEGRK
jgi:hypothetical protein